MSTTRLHISPFTPELLAAVIPPSLHAFATNISFHEIQTFPERNYGYVDLPHEMADKLKKKLNGMLLKGSKMKVEDAKKEKRAITPPEPDAAPGEDNGSARRKSERKRKREEGVIQGVELPEDRKVKRGWTEPATQIRSRRTRSDADAQKTKAQPSKFTNQEELLFQTTAPASTPIGKDSKKTPKKKSKKDGDTVVHEFANTTKHATFIKDDFGGKDQKPTSEFDEEKGWVADDGTVVEKAPKSTGRRKSRRESASKKVQEEADQHPKEDEDAAVEAEGSPPAASPHPLETLFKKPAPPTQSNTPRKPDLSVDTAPFRFFEGDGEDSGPPTARAKERSAKLPNLSIPPMTPFTQRDFHWRRQRSAAPTPDTAAPGKAGFGPLWGPRGDDDVEMGDEEDENGSLAGSRIEEDDAEVGGSDTLEEEAKTSAVEGDGETPRSDFQKWFWENRGANNRAWKKRKRDALKEQRKKENRAEGRRGR